MKNLFEKQMRENKKVTAEILSEMKNKKYFNGDVIKIGDVVLYAMLVGDIIEKDGEIPELPLKLIQLNEQHFHLFEKEEHQDEIPRLKLKS